MPTSATAVGTAHAQGGIGARVASGPTLVVPQKAYATFTTPVAAPSSAACDTIRDTLIKAGWTWTGTIQATGSITAPFGWGYGSFERLVATVGIAAEGGYAYEYYDPKVENPPSGRYNGYQIQPVPITDDPQLSLVNVISNGGVVTASIQNATTILLTANPIGTLGNGIQVAGNGSISIGTGTAGGGWVLQSRSQASVEAGFGNQAAMQLTVQTGAGGNGNVQLVLLIGGTTITWPFGSYAWRMIADTYQVCFVETQFLGGEDLYSGDVSLWACTPVCDSLDGPAHISSAAFVAQGFANTLGNGSADSSMDSWVNGTHFHGGAGNAWAMGAFHSEAGSITDPSGQQLIQAPLVALYVNSTILMRFVGYVGNGFVSSAPATPGDQVAQLGFYFRCVASQNSPPGSVWLMTAETTGDTPTGSSTPPPQGLVGTGDVYGDPTPGSTRSLLVSTGGDAFANSLVGKHVAIGTSGPVYTITQVDSATNLWFIPAVPPVNSIKWEIPLN